MVSKSREDSKRLEDLVETYLTKNNIKFKREEQLISKFRPDFLLEDNTMIECKFLGSSSENYPTSEIRLLSQPILISQLLSKVFYDKNFKQIVILKRETGCCSPSNLLYGNIIFDMFLPFEYLEYLNDYLNQRKSKEDIFFSILDDLFNKFWKKSKSGQFPTNIYHFLLCVENGTYNNVTDFIKNEPYTASNQTFLYTYLRILESLSVVSINKVRRSNYISLQNKKWRYIVYLDTFSKGSFRSINLEYAKDMWSRIVKIFKI